MRPRSVTFAAILTAGVIALLWSRQTYEPLSYYSSASYVERVNAMIRSGALAYNCGDEKITLTHRATPAEEKWFAASYLQNDVELFNRNRDLFGHFFVLEDCQLREINPFLRTIRLPFATSLQWLGNIEYAGAGADATLVSSNGRTILMNRALPNVALREVRTMVGDPGDVAASVVHLDFAGGGKTPGAEVHGVAGSVVVEQRVKRSVAAEIRLLGNLLPEGRVARLKTGDWLHLQSEQPSPRSETFLFTGERMFERLSSVRTRNDRQERVYEEEESLLRFVGGEDGEEMVPFAEAIARALSNAIQQVDGVRAKRLANEFDVQLTIDRALQSSLDTTLSEQTRDLVENLAAGDAFASSLTVMNGKTGEVLAAVSFPGESDLAAMRPVTEEERQRLLVNHNFKRHPIGSAGKPLIYAAVATRHPFLLDLVIAAHQPERRPDGGEGEREDMQFFLGTDYKLWPHGDRPMDFETALERSCNKFTVELATLALAAPRERTERHIPGALNGFFTPMLDAQWPKQPSGIAIGGQELTFAPSLGVYMKDDWKPVPRGEDTTATLVPGTLDRINEAPFIDTFGEIAGIRTYGGLAAPDIEKETTERTGRVALQTMNYDLRPWRPVVEKLLTGEDIGTRWKIRAAFQTVSPERVNLALNQVTDLRTEFISLLLGGASSQWTNIQLAEAFSRLVTKKQVEMSLVRGVYARGSERPPVPAPPAFAELAVGEEARAAVLRGMRRTILGQSGTATILAPLARQLEQRYPGYTVAIYSKTGSPTVVRPEVKPVGAALAHVIRRGRLAFRDGTLYASDGRRTVAYARGGAAGRSEYVATLSRAIRTAAAATGVSVGPRSVTRIIGFTDRFMRYRARLVFAAPVSVRLDATIPMPFHAVAGALVINRDHPVFDPSLESDSSAVYVFSIVKWKNPSNDPMAVPAPADLEREDSRVITTAMFFDVGPGSRIAVEAARAVIPKLAYLLD